jgi:hypothetical protein
MSVYLFGIAPCRPTPVTLADGSTVIVGLKMKLATTNACSSWAADEKRVNRHMNRLMDKWGTNFNGLVFASAPDNGVAVINWTGVPYWFDTDKYPGTTVGILLKKGKQWTAVEKVEAVTLKALPGEPTTLKVGSIGIPPEAFIPAIRVTVPYGTPFPGREVLSRQTIGA